MAISPEIKEAAHRRASGRCEWCGRPGKRANWELHVHHLTYERYGKERLDDVVVVCLRCHNTAHPHYTFRTRAEQEREAKKRAQPVEYPGLSKRERREAKARRAAFSSKARKQARATLRNVAKRIEGKKKSRVSFDDLAERAKETIRRG